MSPIPATPQKPLSVDVIIPVRNRFRFIRQCLDSVRAQTLQPDGVIVVDDGATDDTPRVLADYAREWPILRVVRTPPKGVSSARNTALALSSAQLVAFIDSDDVWDSDKLARQVALFSPDRPLLALVHCGLRQIDEQGQQIDGAKIIVARKRGNVFKDILEAFYGIAPSTIVARRESIMSVGGFDETLVQAEDRDLCLKIAKTWEIDHVPDPLIGLRIHGGSSYGQAKKHNPELVLFERLRVWDRWFDQIDNMEAVLARFRQEAVSTSVSMMLRPTPDFSLYRQLANSDLRLAAHLFPSRPVYLRALFRYSWPGRYLRVLKHKLYEKYKLAIAIVARFKHISASMIPIRSRRRKRMNADDQ